MSNLGPEDWQKEQFRSMFAPGAWWVLFGPRRTGKTSFASSVIDAISKWYPDYEVFTNILFKKKVLLPDGTETFVEWYPERVHKVTSMADVFHAIPAVMEQGRRALLVIDEALHAVGFASGQSVLTAGVRETRAFAAMIGKIQMAVILIAQSWRMVASSYRNEDFITGYIRRRYDNQIIPGYGKYELVEIIGPRGFRFQGDQLVTDPQFTLVLETKPIGLSKPYQLAEVGDVVYDTLAPAKFDEGVYKANGKKFQLGKALDSISDDISENTVAKLRYHLEHPPTGGKQSKQDSEVQDEDADVEDELNALRDELEPKKRPRLTRERIEQLNELLLGGMGDRQIERDYEFEKGTVSYYKGKLREEGKL